MNVTRVVLFGCYTLLSGGAVWGEAGPDIDAFAKLPVRYNGRVASVRLMAPTIQSYFSGRAVSEMSEKDKEASIGWFVDVISNSERGNEYPLIPIGNDAVRRRLNLEADAVKEGLVSIGELKKVSDLLEKLVAEGRRLRPAEQTEMQRALIKIDRLTQRYQALLYSFQTPWSVAKDVRLMLIDYAKKVDGSGSRINSVGWTTPRMIPPRTASEGWRSLLAAGVDHFWAVEVKAGDHKPSEAAFELTMALSAYRNNNVEEFDRLTGKFSQRLREEDHKSPVVFAVPSGWIEAGVPEPYALQSYSDAFEWGFQVAVLEKRFQHERVSIQINHFPRVAVDIPTVVNSWRINRGLLPISPENLQQHLSEGIVAGHRCTAVDMSSPESLPVYGKRVVSRILHHETGTWELSIYGSTDDVKSCLVDFEEFVKEFEFGRTKDVIKWFNVPQLEPFEGPFPGLRVVGAIIGSGSRRWVFRLTGPAAGVTRHYEEAKKLLRSLKFSRTDAPLKTLGAGVEFSLPEGWKQEETGSENVLTFRVNAEELETYVTLQPLAEGDSNPALAMSNHWRTSIGMKTMTAAEFKNSLNEISIGGQTARLVEITSPAEATRKPEAGPIKFKASPRWKPAKKGAFSVAKFRVGENGAEVTVVALPRIAADSFASISNNINRWRSQVGVESLSVEEQRKAVQSVQLDGEEAVFVEIVGKKESILGVVQVRGEKAWFVKMKGPMKDVSAELKRFRDFVETIEFAKSGDG